MRRWDFRYAPSLILAGVVVFAIVLAVRIAVAAHEVILVVFLGIVLGVALSPAANFGQRYGIPRSATILVVYFFVALILAGFVWYAVPRVANEAGDMSAELQTLQSDYESLAGDNTLPTIDEILTFLRGRAGAVAPSLFNQAFVVITLLLYMLTVLVVAVFYSVVQEPAHRLVLSLVSPRHRDRTDEVLGVMASRLRRYVLGQLISMSVIGGITYIGLLLLGIPFPFTLAVIAFLGEFLPMVGPWISFVPALALAATQGWKAVLLVSGFYLLLQQIENHAVTPVVQNRQTELPGLVIIAALLIGGTLMGLLGALAAIPMAIVIQTLLTRVVIPWRQKRVREQAAREDRERGEPTAA